MQPKKHHFDDVSLLVTIYNRSSSLARLLAAFSSLDVSFGEVIVSDDASKEPHRSALVELAEQYGFKLVGTPENKGLGHNINKGQRAVTKPYTVYVQEDFVPKSTFLENFENALDIMKSDQSIDTIRFYGYSRYPYTKPYGRGFDEMIFKPSLFRWDHLKFYVYSDHPHLRRSSFLERFGPYVEGRGGDYTEFQMCLAYIKKHGRGLVTPTISDIFDQMNSIEEPSTTDRGAWKESPNPIIKLMRRVYLVYRYLKNNIQLWSTK